MMFSAQAFDVAGMGQPARAVGCGVVEVAAFGGAVAAGEAAGEVSVSHEPRQFGRGSVARFGTQFGGVGQGVYDSAEADEFGE
jgi:hypothetical protein